MRTRRNTATRLLAITVVAALAIGFTAGCASAPGTDAAVSGDGGDVFDVQASDGRAAGAMLRATTRAAVWAEDPADFFFILMFGSR